MGDPRQHIGERADPQPEGRARRQFDQREQDQDDRRIFDEIGVRAHPPRQQAMAGIAMQDLVPDAEAGASNRQPQVQ